MLPETELQPVEITLDRVKHLKMLWSDGSESTIALLQLRKACPCAGCREERAERAKNPLAVMPPEGNVLEMVTVAKAELVGNYALKITWNDGHDVGLYDYALLREISG